MVSWFSIVSKTSSPPSLSFPRWWIDKTKTCIITSSLLNTSSSLLFLLFLTFTLSFFSVDGVKIGDSIITKVEDRTLISIPMRMMNQSSISSTTVIDEDYYSSTTTTGTQRTKDGKSKHEKQVRNKRKSFNTSSKIHEAQNNDKALSGRELNWDSVVILDEHEFDDEINTKRTRINFLPEGKLISTFLNRGMNGRFLFLNSEVNNTITVVLTPCNSILTWSINFLPQLGITTKIYIELKSKKVLETFRTQRTVNYKTTNSQRGVYALEIRPVYSDTFVHILVSTSSEFFNPFHLQVLNSSSHDIGNETGSSHIYNFLNTNQPHQSPTKPWIRVKRLRGNRIQVKWETSPINPHTMHYCIAVNSRRDYNSLCGAQGDKYGFLPPDLRHLPLYPFYPESKQNSEESISNINSSEIGDNEIVNRKPLNEIVVGCLRKKTNYILTDLIEGRLYYFNVFVKDILTGLSYPYVRTTLKYRTPKRIPNQLRDAKPHKVTTIGSTPVTLTFNLKKPCTELSIYVMPCGSGPISYRIFTENHTLHEGKSDTLDLIKMAFPIKGKYFIEVSQVLAGTTTAEVFVSKKQKKLPLPKLPVRPQVFEIQNEKSCDAVTISWHPSPEPRDNEYCIFLKEETRKTILHFKKPNQCDIDRSLQADPYVTHSLCIQKNPRPENEYLTQKINGLLPGRVYVLQLILRRHNGKALSYDLTYVTTTEKCPEDTLF